MFVELDFVSFFNTVVTLNVIPILKRLMFVFVVQSFSGLSRRMTPY